MIAAKRLDELKSLFHEDGIDLSEGAAVEVGHWLLERAKSVCVPIPPEKQCTYKNIAVEMQTFEGLHKNGLVRDNPANL